MILSNVIIIVFLLFWLPTTNLTTKGKLWGKNLCKSDENKY